MTHETHNPPTLASDGRSEASRTDTALRRIGDALHGLRFGSVLAIVQDGVVVQIERTEKTRLEKTTPPRSQR